MAYCAFTTGSLVLTAAMLAVGITFFSPFWLMNLKPTEQSPANATFLIDVAVANGAMVAGPSYLTYTGNYSRGLWAECGGRCQWFWENGFMLQMYLFTPLKWHLATQVLYTVGAVLVLFTELFSRVQLCCGEPRRGGYTAVTILLFISFVMQLAAVSIFGRYSWSLYTAQSNPLENYAWQNTTPVYFGWSFWMSLAGGGLTLIACVIFAILACVISRRWEK